MSTGWLVLQKKEKKMPAPCYPECQEEWHLPQDSTKLWGGEKKKKKSSLSQLHHTCTDTLTATGRPYHRPCLSEKCISSISMIDSSFLTQNVNFSSYWTVSWTEEPI